VRLVLVRSQNERSVVTVAKVVPLVIYKNGKDRTVVGVATVHEDTGFVDCTITDDGLLDAFHLSVNDCSIGWFHPAALAKDFRGGASLNDLVTHGDLSEVNVRFMRPSLEEL
jgi:hypothetical protein